jgi:CheY-like chemotaxis protein
MKPIRKLLVIEDDTDNANLLKLYFSAHGFTVETATRGPEGLEKSRQSQPDLILLDINLPEMNGFAVCQALRNSPRTSHIPVIFVSEKNSQSDRRAGLGAGAQDYVTKPFDLEELRLRIQNVIARAERENMLDPRSGLPTGRLVDEQIRNVHGQPGWTVLECRVDALRPFIDINGFAAGDEVLKFTANLLQDMLDQYGTPEDFIGHPANDTFVILTATLNPAALIDRLRTRFNEEVKAHYSFMDVEQGHILIRDSNGQTVPAPLMTLQVTKRANGK